MTSDAPNRGRVSWPVFALASIGCVVVLVYWSATRTRDDGADSVAEQTAAARVEPAVNASPVSDAEQPLQEAAAGAEEQPAKDAAAGGPQPVNVAQLIADATSGDPEKRAAAIAALGRAPKSEALPVLRRVVNSGEPKVDRPLALRSLRDLALYQGDEDGGIRTVVREVIYHGDDEGLAGAAQETLDVIEESEQK